MERKRNSRNFHRRGPWAVGLRGQIARFLTGTSGAISVDWVVLSAATVGVSLTTVTAMRLGLGELSTDISTSLSGAGVAGLGAMGSNGLEEQCPSDWSSALVDDYGFDPADFQTDIDDYAGEDTDTLLTLLDNYTRNGGWGISGNENNVQIILCELANRGTPSNTRVL